MLTRAELKYQAKEQLKGKVGILFVVLLVYVAVTIALMIVAAIMGAIFPPLMYVGVYAVISPLVLGYYQVYLETTYGDWPRVSTLFKPFKESWLQSVLLIVLVGIFTFLWSLLLVVPGIIKSFSYSQAFFILAENPDMTANEAITESRIIMNGHKMEFFVLYLSFIPWMLLGAVTLGIAHIWITPYMTLTMTNFYHNIKRQNAPVAETPVYEDAMV